MANGDAALAAGMTIVSGQDSRSLGYDEINKTRDYIATRVPVPLTVAKGGTGATDAAGARTNLGISKTPAATPGALVERDANGRASIVGPTSTQHIANKSYVDSTVVTATQPIALELAEALRIIDRLTADVDELRARMPK